LKEIQSEIAGIIRQITASVSFLPLLSEACSFDLLVYTDTDAEVPRAWEESDPRHIAGGEELQLRSFSTKVHKVSAAVTYRRGEGDDEV
jgi:mitotic spindle assembly checkpoint protein MAD2